MKNLPKLVYQKEETDPSAFPYLINITELKWNGHTLLKTTHQAVDDNSQQLFSFVTRNGKTIQLRSADQSLLYIVTSKTGAVDFFYPHSLKQLNSSQNNFVFDKTKDEETLAFKSDEARYTVYQRFNPKQVGVRILTHGKIDNWPVDVKTLTGHLEQSNLKLKNVSLRPAP